MNSAVATITVKITAVNDAPVANGSATLAPVNEDIGSNAPGATVASLFAANFSDSQDNPANTFAGVAVSSYIVDSAKEIGSIHLMVRLGQIWHLQPILLLLLLR